MVDQNIQRDREYVRETHTSGGGMSVMAFIVGGLVVLVGILAFVFWGDLDGSFGGAGTSTGGGGVSVTVESEAPSAPAATDGAAEETAAPDAATTGGADVEAGN